MKEKLNQIVTAAKILQQMPTENSTQLAIKKGAVDTLFKDIGVIVAEMDMADSKKRPDYFLKGSHVANDGREKSFTTTCDGKGGFMVYIRVIITEADVRIYIEADFDGPFDQSSSTDSPAKVCD